MDTRSIDIALLRQDAPDAPIIWTMGDEAFLHPLPEGTVELTASQGQRGALIALSAAPLRRPPKVLRPW